MPLTEAQLAKRRRGMTATDLAAICGLDDYRGPNDVYNEKLSLVPDDFEGNVYTDFGNWLEPYLVEWYVETTGRRVRLAGPEDTIVSATHPWVMATPDAFVLDEETDEVLGLVEAKTASWRMQNDWGEEGTDDVPRKYLVQCQWQAFAVDVPWVDVPALVDRERRLYRVQRNERLISKLYDVAYDFWNGNVLQRRPPAPDASDACLRRLATERDWEKTKYAPSTKQTDDLIASLKAQTEIKNAADDAIRLIRNQIAAAVGSDFKGATSDVGSVYWVKSRDQAKTDWEKLALDLGATQDQIDEATRFVRVEAYLSNAWKKKKK